MKTTLLRLLTCLILAQSIAYSQPIPDVWFDQLTSRSDLVVLVLPVASQATTDPYFKPPLAPSQEIFEAYNTTFKVRAIFKSTEKFPKEITVLHYLYTEHANPDTDHAPLVKFLGVGAPENISGPAGLTNEPPEQWHATWIAFLKRMPDGRYEPATGQNYSSISFRVLKWEDYSRRDVPAVVHTDLSTVPSRPLNLWKAFFAVVLLGGLASFVAPCTARGRGAQHWLRIALWLCGSIAIVASVLGFKLLIPLLLDDPMIILAEAILFGMCLGLLVLMVASGELHRAFPRRKSAS